MAQVITIDPVTRIEGHLRIDVEVEGGVVKDAWSSGTMFRGFEMLLKGKHPFDAQQVTERICGVCPLAHGTAASYNLDDALGVELPDNARIIRNLCLGANFIQSHILHFYHLAALDYVDITAVANYEGKDRALKILKNKIVNLVETGDVYPFLPRYESEDYVSDPELATTLVGHYVEALEMRKKAHEMLAIFYGRVPSFVGTVPGGVTTGPTVLNTLTFKAMLAELRNWINDVYIQDILTVAGFPAYAPFMAAGDSGGNYLVYGGFDEDQMGKKKFLPRGIIYDNDVMNVKEFDEAGITESVKHSWYTKQCEGLNPSEGETEPDVHKEGAYSFLKAPRYDGKPMEVGPLARMLVMKPKPLMDLVGKLGLLDRTPLKFGILPRHAARAIECKVIADEMDKWLDQLKPGKPIWDKKGIPGEAHGRGLLEAARGALGHWIHIKGKKIEDYQCVVPTTWNASPRDKEGNRGPIERSLVGIPVPDPDNPINVVRCIRSFDPCLACAIHIIHPDHNGVKEFRVV
ncbi:MAG: nickel-dependent hydrogenase large subunit [Actinomycetia bacterium]|nr:nickel-dependent hydrogenase large subunit [Actinomycetota bacterium]MBU4302734.1 nickel-dependent hydrogenase large subunit [Actinomycetota bacterium]MCG2794759.1 nickel-dependent hydrogenase large subunit [Actinomycetes bacterium]